MVASPHAQLVTDSCHPTRAAHRGLSGVFPEHTARAYQEAIKAGADFIECDGEWQHSAPPPHPAACRPRPHALPPAHQPPPCDHLAAVVPTKDCSLICRHENDLA